MSDKIDEKLQKNYSNLLKKIEEKLAKEMDNKLREAKQKIYNDVVKLKPDLDDKDKLYDIIVNGEKEKEVKAKTKGEEIVVTEMEHNGSTYYADSTGSLWNDKAEPVGVVNVVNGELIVSLYTDNIDKFDRKVPTLD